MGEDTIRYHDSDVHGGFGSGLVELRSCDIASTSKELRG